MSNKKPTKGAKTQRTPRKPRAKPAADDPFVPNEFGVIEAQNAPSPGAWNGKLDTKACDSTYPFSWTCECNYANTELACTHCGKPKYDAPEPNSDTVSVSSSKALDTERHNETGAHADSQEAEDSSTREASAPDSTQSAPQADTQTNENEEGGVSSTVAETATTYAVPPIAHEETRAQATNRWILEGRRWETDRFRQDLIRRCRGDGMTKSEASEHAWKACLAQFPPPGVEPSIIEEPSAIEPPEPENTSTVVDTPDKPPEEDVPGLGDMPEDWPELPANASLQAEISWVSANRLRVRSGRGVDLAKALSPAPSYSALSWLETSILFPSKFADISVKATQNQEDEKEHIRREKMAIEEIRGLLEEMLED